MKSLISVFNHNKSFLIFFIASLFFLTIRLEFAIFIDAFVPDELWHTGYMKKFNIENYQGFGAVYWILGHIVYFLFGDIYLFILRFLAIFSICIAGFCFYKIIQLSEYIRANKILIFLFILIFYSTPFLWYTGKLITPEFYLISIIFFSYYWILAKKNNFKILPHLLLGLSVGIKLSSISSIFPIYVYKLFIIDRDISLRKIIIRNINHVALLLIGFVFASPDIVWDFEGFITRLAGNSSARNLTINDLYYRFFNLSYAWDLVLINGIEFCVISLFSIVAMGFIMILNRSYKIFLIYTLSILFLLIIISLNGNFLVWYVFTLIIYPITLCCLSFKKLNIKRLKFVIIIATSIILVNGYRAYNTYKPTLELRDVFKKDIANYENTTICLNEALINLKENDIYSINKINFIGNHKHINSIFNYYDIAKNFSLNEVEGKNKDYFKGFFYDHKLLKIVFFVHKSAYNLLNLDYQFDFYNYKMTKSENLNIDCGNVNVFLSTYESK
jgi:hypothetical protein